MNDEPASGPRIDGAVIPQDQGKAEQVASIILEAARADVGLLRAEMTGIRSVTTAIQAELMLLANKADVLRAHADLQARIERVESLLANKADVLGAHADLQARIERVERRLLMGFGVLAGMLAALVVAALRYLPTVGHS